MLKRLIFLSLALLIGFSPRGTGSAVRADELPRGELLHLVGADAGLCVEVTDLGRRVPQLVHSELFDRLEKFPVYRDWKQSTEFQKLSEIRKVVENQTGQPITQFAMNLFGQSVVFAVYPREIGEPAGVLLLRAPNQEALDKALAAWNSAERVKVEAVPFSKSLYQRRTESKGNNEQGRPQFYFTEGPIFALSDEESVIRDIVKRSLGEMELPSLSASENYRTAISSLPADSWATLYFDPRPWRTGWEFDEGKSKAEKIVAGLWKRCHAVAAGLRTDQGLAVDFVLHYDPADLPERWQRLVERTSGFPEFLNQVPARALVVFAGKQDLTGLDRIIAAELNEQARLQWQNARQIGRGFLLGLDLFEDVLPQFEPNWGVYVVPREPLDQEALPIEGLLAIGLPPGPQDNNPINVRKALENALSTGFNLLAAMQNSNSPPGPAVVKSEERAGSRVHWVETIGPYRPAYSLSNEYLIFASSPALIEEFLSAEEPKLTASRVYRLWSQRQEAAEGQVLFISWQSIREFLLKNETFLLEQAVASHALPRDEAEKRFKRLRDALKVLDAVYLSVQILPDRIRITAGGITAE
jgi:hypothetical protein